MQSILYDLGIKTTVRCFTDSSAAIGVTKRTGIGKIRHLQTQFLWVQELLANGRAQINKVGTHNNPADLMTKYLDSSTTQHHIKLLNLQESVIRPAMAPKLRQNINQLSTQHQSYTPIPCAINARRINESKYFRFVHVCRPPSALGSVTLRDRAPDREPKACGQ